jgi:hypothetical protein
VEANDSEELVKTDNSKEWMNFITSNGPSKNLQGELTCQGCSSLNQCDFDVGS